MNPPVLSPPAAMWETNRRPYFHTATSPINKLHRDLPWNERLEIVDSKDSNLIAEEEGLEIGELLGYGSYSAVHRGYWKPHRLNVAVKIYEKPTNRSSNASHALPALKRVIAEVNSLKKLKHPNIVGFFGAVETKYRVYLILEVVGKGNLLQYLKNVGPLGESNLSKKLFGQLVCALTFVHHHEIAHRDIKCENILLDLHLNIRLSDFGFAKSNLTWMKDVPNDCWIKIENEFCGSIAYMSPELIKKIPYSPILGDVWSTGVVLYGMVFGKFPYEVVSAQSIVKLPKRFKFPEGVKASPQLADICQSIFVREHKRIRSYELLEKKWLELEVSSIFLGKMAHSNEGEAKEILKYGDEKIPEESSVKTVNV